MAKTADVMMVSIPRTLGESIRRGIQDIRNKQIHSEEDFLELYEDILT